MPAITGSVKNIVGGSMASQVVELVFRLNGPGIQAAGGSKGTIHPTDERRVTPDSSSDFTVNLVTTTTMLTDAWYEIGIVWQGSKEPLWDYPTWQVRVDSSGSIDEKIAIGPPQGGWGGQLPNLSLVLVSPTRPDNLQVGQLWLQLDADNPTSSQSTGNLYKGR